MDDETQLPRRRSRVRAVLCLGALLALSATLPGRTDAEQASDPVSPAAAALDAGRHHTCALLPDGKVRCWGYGREGELGYGNGNTIGDDETPAAAGPVDLGAGRTAVAISAGDFHTCAILDDRAVRCWGLGGNGRLGYPGLGHIGDNETPGSVGPVDLGQGRTAKAIAAGGVHTCAILDDDTVRCWGFGLQGQVGYGNLDPDPSTPIIEAPGPNIGDDETPGSMPPVSLGTGRTAKAITAGDQHTCAILDDDTVKCWGYGGNGQLGYGNTQNVADQQPVLAGAVDLGAGRTARAISAGVAETCAVLDDGSLRCWGFGGNGRLGYGNGLAVGDDETPGSMPPVDLGTGRTARSISVGGGHACAVLDDFHVRCWGTGFDGRLGHGNTLDVGDDEAPGAVGPVNLGAGRTALAVLLGSRHTCARLDDGNVRCWGYGPNGRLGYCNERNIGDDETPAAAGPVDLGVPGSGAPGCVRPPGGSGGPLPPPAQAADALYAFEAETRRRAAFRACSRRAARHWRREVRRARRLAGTRRVRALRHAKRHRSRARRACVRRHGRRPGRVTALTAQASSRHTIVLRFRAAGSDGDRPPAARSYVVKQSLRPIRSARAFRRAVALCSGRCRFRTIRQVGARLDLTVTDLRRRTTYYYAVAARDNVSGMLGRRSPTVRVTTR